MRARTLCTLSAAAVACTAAGLTVAVAFSGSGRATSPAEVAAVRRDAGRPVVPPPARVLAPAASATRPGGAPARPEAPTRSEGWQTTRARAVRLRALAARLPDVAGKTRRRRVVVEMAALTTRLGADLDATTRATIEDRIGGLTDPRLAWRLRRSLTP